MSVDLRLCAGFYYSTSQQQDEAVLLLTHKTPLCARTLSLPVVRGWLFGSPQTQGVLFNAHVTHTLKLAVLYPRAATHMGSRERFTKYLILQYSLLPAQKCLQIPAGSLVKWNKLSTHSNHQELLITYFCKYTGQLSSAWVSQSLSNKKWLLVRLEQKNWL